MLDVMKFVGDLHEYIERALRPITDRLKVLEHRVPEKGEKGDPGSDAEPVLISEVVRELLGTDELNSLVELRIRESIASLPPPKDGKDGRDGKDAAAPPPEKIDYDVVRRLVDDAHDRLSAKYVLDFERRISDVVQKALADMASARLDGVDRTGERAEPPPVDYDKVRALIADIHEHLVAKYMLDFERRATDQLQNAIDRLPAPKDGKDGRDGNRLDGVSREYDPNAHEIVERWTAGAIEQTLRYPAGGIHPGGYWQDGTKAKACQAWTANGALWVAVRDTTSKPDIKSADWLLCARKGRDGKDGVNGRDAPSVVKLNER